MGWVQKDPHLVFRHEGGLGGAAETPASRRNARGRCGVGRNAPHLAFQCEGAIGEWSKPPIASKREREVWGG